MNVLYFTSLKCWGNTEDTNVGTFDIREATITIFLQGTLVKKSKQKMTRDRESPGATRRQPLPRGNLSREKRRRAG